MSKSAETRKPYQAFERHDSNGVTLWLGPFKRGREGRSKTKRCYTVYGSMRWGALKGRCTRCAVWTVDKDHRQFSTKRRIEVHHQSGARPMRLESATPNITLLQRQYVPTKKDQEFLGQVCAVCGGTEDVPADFMIETVVKCSQREIAYFGYDAIRMTFTLLEGVREVVSDGVDLREKTDTIKQTAIALSRQLLKSGAADQVADEFRQGLRRALLSIPGAEDEHLDIVTREIIRLKFPGLGIKPPK